MTDTAFALFDTPVGRCALIWRGPAVIGFALPEGNDRQLRAIVSRRLSTAIEAQPPPAIAAAIEAVLRLLSGEAEGFAGIEIDLSGLPSFERRVLEAAFAIPPGETRTYGEIAERVGVPGAARAVGRALGRNPIPVIVPCHRVLGADGRSGGFSAPGGVLTKLRLLEIEHATRGAQPALFKDLAWSVAPAKAKPI